MKKRKPVIPMARKVHRFNHNQRHSHAKYYRQLATEMAARGDLKPVEASGQGEPPLTSTPQNETP